MSDYYDVFNLPADAIAKLEHEVGQYYPLLSRAFMYLTYDIMAEIREARDLPPKIGTDAYWEFAAFTIFLILEAQES